MYKTMYTGFDSVFADKLMKYFELSGKIKYKALSQGMGSIFNFLCALACRSPLTMLDEPVLRLARIYGFISRLCTHPFQKAVICQQKGATFETRRKSDVFVAGTWYNSKEEQRYFTRWPAFSIEKVLDGSYGTRIEEYFSDHFPLREFWVQVSRRLSNSALED